MFNNMKNKIREKTGTELPKFNASTSLFTKSRSNQHSRQNSQGSITSITSEQNMKDDDSKSSNSVASSKSSNTPEKTHVTDASASTIDWENKLHEKEKEWREKERTYVTDLLKQTKELQETITLTEDFRKKYACCQEEKEQLEIYQKQEISKIKELLLSKEEENNRNIIALKDALISIDSLKQEVNRLKPFEEKISHCQDDLEYLRHSSEKEIWNLTSRLAQKEETVRHLEERIAVLTHRTEADCQALGAQLSTDERVRSLIAERALLERRLEEAHIHLAEIKTSWSDKIAILETQVGRLSRQAGEEGVERRNAEIKITDLESKLELLEKEKEQMLKKMEKLMKERDSIASELRQLSMDSSKFEENSAGADKYNELMTQLEVLSKENEALRQSNEESRRILDESLAEEVIKNSELDAEILKLREYAHELETALGAEKKVKDQTLLRNAEISQRVQLSEQEVKEQSQQNEELFKKVNDLESQLESSEQSLKNLKVETNGNCVEKDNAFQNRILELESEITDKNKTIKILQQNLNDVRKTFQMELKNRIETNKPVTNNCPVEEDINFKYMKHVLIKFLTSSEYEAQQLTKAVATLLKLSSEEERLIKETLEWRSSWFSLKQRSKPHFNPS